MDINSKCFQILGRVGFGKVKTKITGLKLLSVFKATNYHDVVVVWCPGVMVFTNAGLQLQKSELGF